MILTISYLTIIQDFLPLALGSADVILGISWLETLGKIQFDFHLSVMDFRIGDWQVHIQGDRGLVKSQVSLKAMMKARDKTTREFLSN